MCVCVLGGRGLKHVLLDLNLSLYLDCGGSNIWSACTFPHPSMKPSSFLSNPCNLTHFMDYSFTTNDYNFAAMDMLLSLL